jgi:hypothetical protein
MRFVLAILVVTLAASGRADAVTPAELAALARAGLGDEVLLALVETTGLTAAVEGAEALELKRAGVSDRVIAAAVRASKPPAAVGAVEPPPCEPCEPNIAVIGDAPPLVVVERQVYYLPWVWGAPVVRRPVPAKPYFEGDRGFGRFINDGVRRPPRSR